ncbi:SMP-30/gluconolactonase/LRE family protein [Acerihabitans arboris]|uniref:SMP-30/gluconolactonase/LRE family protein n=1 Tax=Acerihabitans arboris TaxID=2691583 RepID=A0A845S9D0_9GAMM|nr:SMP-30/gluconolactonase/LRE family protein [Acerihabitans arboris]NDL61330.1 SMP-30/gluconolactonase/LRE family protein [Acerihabitans arboris]
MSDFFTSPVHAIGDYRAALGETPVWCSRSQSLLWVDILRHRLLRYWPGRQHIEQRRLDCLFSGVLLTEREELFLVVSQQGMLLYRYDGDNARLEMLCPYPADAAGTRPNEAAIAPDGSLWFSTMDLEEERPIGGWYRFAAGDAGPRKMMGHVTIPNTLAWYGDIVWFADSAEKRFYASDAAAINPDRLRVFDADGLTPDGSALTSAGELINARFGHACLSRYAIGDGWPALLEHLPLPVRQPSCCAFGGPGRNELFITSAGKNLDSPGEFDGALLHVATRATGAPQHRFRLE